METNCNCDKEVDLNNVPETLETFEYIGVDDNNNPIFRCKKCKVEVCG